VFERRDAGLDLRFGIGLAGFLLHQRSQGFQVAVRISNQIDRSDILALINRTRAELRNLRPSASGTQQEKKHNRLTHRPPYTYAL
jgi:hypothetical protein